MAPKVHAPFAVKLIQPVELRLLSTRRAAVTLDVPGVRRDAAALVAKLLPIITPQLTGDQSAASKLSYIRLTFLKQHHGH
jgi:hypothetical protein